jgi:hypothetical protein
MKAQCSWAKNAADMVSARQFSIFETGCGPIVHLRWHPQEEKPIYFRILYLQWSEGLG